MDICYWQVPMPEWDFPVRIVERTNEPEDIGTSDWSLHWHENLEFQYVKAGAVQLSCQEGVQWVRPQEIFFANWCEPHHAVGFESHSRYYVIQVDLEWILGESWNTRLAQYRDAFVLHAQSFRAFIMNDSVLCGFFDEIIQEYALRESGYELRVKGVFLSVICHLYRHHFHPEQIRPNDACYDASFQYTRRILNYINHHFDSPITLKNLAAETGITTSYICQLFKRHTGCTVTQYINRLRCYRAISLIETGMSVTQASLAVGYNDYNYFSRVFKRFVGIRPTDSMKRIQEDLKK